MYRGKKLIHTKHKRHSLGRT